MIVKIKSADLRKRDEKGEKKEGEKEIMFLKVSTAALHRGDFPFGSPARGLQPLHPAAGRFAI